jgi:hypothetical protein
MGVRDVYFDLAKRLDDSNDQVRIAACTMLKSFAVTATPGDFRGGPVEYIVDCLLVHLDDTDRSIQVGGTTGCTCVRVCALLRMCARVMVRDPTCLCKCVV